MIQIGSAFVSNSTKFIQPNAAEMLIKLHPIYTSQYLSPPLLLSSPLISSTPIYISNPSIGGSFQPSRTYSKSSGLFNGDTFGLVSAANDFLRPAAGTATFSASLSALAELQRQEGSAVGLFILLFPGCLAFLMTASEYALLQRTSVVTLSICGILKEVLTISTASLVFHDEISTINGLGLVITILTIAAYNYMKISKMRQDARLSDSHYAHPSSQSPSSPLSPSSSAFFHHSTNPNRSSTSYASAAGGDAALDSDDERDAVLFAASAVAPEPPGALRDALNVAAPAAGRRKSLATETSPKVSPLKRPEDLE